ncbi:MAG: hypothetical protein AAFV80_13805 [Bacteroidota bacterium]
MKTLLSSFFGLVSLLIAGQVVQSCQEAPTIFPAEYAPTRLPADTTLLFIGDGNLDLDTVFVIGEGGPKSRLSFESSGRVYWEYLQRQSNFYFAVIHQSSTLNQKIFTAPNFGEKEALHEAQIAAEILHRTIQYFKTRGKYVVVTGHSYSAFLIPNYLADYGNGADRYLLTGGRLDADSMQTALQFRGINSGFDENGETLILPDLNAKPNRYRRARYHQIRRNKEWIKYATGYRRFTQVLKDMDLSNLHFYYGLQDENVGRLRPYEIQFLETHGATVKAVESDHYDIWQAVVNDLDQGILTL